MAPASTYLVADVLLDALLELPCSIRYSVIEPCAASAMFQYALLKKIHKAKEGRERRRHGECEV